MPSQPRQSELPLPSDQPDNPTREWWIEVGTRLSEAQRRFGKDKRAFGQWVQENGYEGLPGSGKHSNILRSDAIWMARHPARVEKVPEKVTSPRAVRAAWQRLLKGAIQEAEIDLREGQTDRAEALRRISEQTGLDDQEAERHLSRASEAPNPLERHIRSELRRWKTEGVALPDLLRLMSEAYADR